MSCYRNATALAVAFALALGVASCGDASPATGPVGAPTDGAHFSAGAVVEEATLVIPFPPNPNRSVPVAAPCLGLDVPLTISGMWIIHLQRVRAPSGRVHLRELIDYSGVAIRAGALTWQPGPGAQETIVFNAGGDGARTLIHEFHARYLSQDGLRDLRVSHSWHAVRGPDGTLIRNEFAPFTAECLGA